MTVQTLRYIKPPESLVTQLDVYTEEKFEDEEDMRERARNLHDTAESPHYEPAVNELLTLAARDEGLYTAMIAAFQRLSQILRKDIGRSDHVSIPRFP